LIISESTYNEYETSTYNEYETSTSSEDFSCTSTIENATPTEYSNNESFSTDEYKTSTSSSEDFEYTLIVEFATPTEDSDIESFSSDIISLDDDDEDYEITDNEYSRAFSLLTYEENIANYNLCKPYINYNELPAIGYGRLCSKQKVNNQNDLKKKCKNLINNCNSTAIHTWLDEDINKAIQCIQECSLCKKAFDAHSTKRKSILISLAHSMGCNKFKKLNFFENFKNGNWRDVNLKLLTTEWYQQNYNRAIRHMYVIENNDCCPDFCNYYQWEYENENINKSNDNNSNNRCDKYYCFKEINKFIQNYEEFEKSSENQSTKNQSDSNNEPDNSSIDHSGLNNEPVIPNKSNSKFSFYFINFINIFLILLGGILLIL